ncbi:sulfatase-like hydrolase/transferase [Niabella sp. W65]|nr:sulfatase-like hydrolase/transferase [Niabella sp. W65]MCH7364703.1 sulfatase-like hydrolase/transferase [Niabella sp. W65]ULT40552.1 sulfatase-like hydrolase/transferase [Niabella sp. I65]
MLKQRYYFLYFACLLLLACGCKSPQKEQPASRPNILIIMSDNQSANHVGVYGDATVRTPQMDSIAREGVRFTNAFCNSPSCTPSRAGYLTGQDIWRLKEGANLWSILPTEYPLYTDLLEASGYEVGFQEKAGAPAVSKPMAVSTILRAILTKVLTIF